MKLAALSHASRALAAAGATFCLSLVINTPAAAQTGVFRLSSPDIPAGGDIALKHVLNGFGCSGQNVSPALEWSNPPAGTKSFAIQMYDPDAPTGSGFWHWGVYNIPGSVSGLAAGAGNSASTLPAGAKGGLNDFHGTGTTGADEGNYGGPCPPPGHGPNGKHRYIFTIFALDVPDLYAAAGIPPSGTSAVHGFALNYGLGSHMLGTASFMAYFGR